MIGLARLGRDAEVRTTQGGDKVASLSLAFSFGRKDQDGKRPTQWVDGALWGKRAEVLAPYLLKGRAVVVTIDDPHIEEYEGRNGRGYKLAGTVSAIELAGTAEGGQQQRSGTNGGAQAYSPSPANPPQQRAPAPPPPQSAGTGFDGMDDEIPF